MVQQGGGEQGGQTADHYAVLGLAPGAGQEAIAAAYKAKLGELRAALAAGNPPAPAFLDTLRQAYKALSQPRIPVAAEKPVVTGPSADSGPGPVPFPGSNAEEAGMAPPTAFPGAADTGSMDQGARRSLAFQFTGEGGEYFRIWITNLLLSIITLGFYSPWAKVRREQYFHRNLVLDGAGFDYHGDPRAILKGRALALVGFMVLNGAEHLGVAPYLGALAVLAVAAPWLLMRSFRFRAHNTSYRGLRFAFLGTYPEALKVFVGYGLLTLVTLGFAAPAWIRAQKQYLLNNLRYGNGVLRCDMTLGAIYRPYLMVMLGGLGVFAVIIAMVLVLGFMAGGAFSRGAVPSATMMMAISLVPAGLILTFNLLIIPYLHVRVGNALWGSTRLNDDPFTSQLSVWPYFRLMAGNFLLTLLTLGLFFPWAKVRTARYRAQCLALETVSLGRFHGLPGEDTAALGDEAMGMLDFDVAL